MRADPEFEARLNGQQLTTAEIIYHLPDHPHVLQSFLWQTLDTAPDYPRLIRFLDHWKREIEAVIHSVHVAGAPGLAPAKVRPVVAQFRIQ
jgi:uncharacterized protein Usg